MQRGQGVLGGVGGFAQRIQPTAQAAETPAPQDVCWWPASSTRQQNLRNSACERSGARGKRRQPSSVLREHLGNVGPICPGGRWLEGRSWVGHEARAVDVDHFPPMGGSVVTLLVSQWQGCQQCGLAQAGQQRAAHPLQALIWGCVVHSVG